MKKFLFGILAISCTLALLFFDEATVDNIQGDDISVNQNTESYCYDIADRDGACLEGDIPLIHFVNANSLCHEVSKKLHKSKSIAYKLFTSKEFIAKSTTSEYIFHVYCTSNVHALSMLRRLNI